MAERVIRRVRLEHCKRGPERCELCREMDREAWCLLELYRPGESPAQRRVIELERDGEPAWWEFEVLRVFGGEQEARAYAAEHGISAGK